MYPPQRVLRQQREGKEVTKERSSDRPDSGSVVDANVCWRAKRVFWPPKRELEPEGIFPYGLPDGMKADWEDAEWYMRELILMAGIDADAIEGWQDCLKVSWGIHLPMPDGAEVPQGTLYLGINVNRRAKWAQQLGRIGLQLPADVCEAMKEDPEISECGQRLLHDSKIFRVWLDVKDRRFDTVKLPKYDNPMARYAARPKIVKKISYHVPLTHVDVVTKK